MKTWKVWAITAPILALLILFGICIWLWNMISTNWGPEEKAAQYVLNHTPINHLESYQVFTASGVEDVFRGTDSFSHEWYAFYIPAQNKAYSFRVGSFVGEQQIQNELSKQNVHISSMTIGYVTDQAANTVKPSSHVIYEISGTKAGQPTYLYVDARTGDVLT